MELGCLNPGHAQPCRGGASEPSACGTGVPHQTTRALSTRPRIPSLSCNGHRSGCSSRLYFAHASVASTATPVSLKRAVATYLLKTRFILSMSELLKQFFYGLAAAYNTVCFFISLHFETINVYLRHNTCTHTYTSSDYMFYICINMPYLMPIFRIWHRSSGWCQNSIENAPKSRDSRISPGF